MKIALLSGAIKNSGDFLIVKRSKELIKYVYPNCEIIEFNRNKTLSNELKSFNKCDIAIFAGGPGYLPNLYPDVIPLVSDLDLLKPKLFSLGMGWYGSDSSNDSIYNYKFSEQTIRLLKRIEKDSKILGCRDWISVKILKNNGFKNVIMTGCPAWYNINENMKDIRWKEKIKKICISDPADMRNIKQAYELVSFIKQKYPDAEIKFMFHRGYKQDLNTTNEISEKLNRLKEYMEGIGIICVDMSYGADKFKEYDKCDLHVGYRVHAHIYNLSIKNRSILIEEDGRGAGVNEALGLQSIKSYQIDIGKKSLLFKKKKEINRNKFLMKILDDYLFQLENSNFLQIKNAIKNMENYYKYMINHIKSIKEVIGK